jgi:hypothetical protein
LAVLFLAVSTFAQAKNPAVLFTSGLHLTYFAQPLHAEGIELDTSGDLPAQLASGKYNVVVITGGFADPKVGAALKAFMEAGGGVLMTPNVYWTPPEYLATQHFLEGYGAHFTMSTIQDSDPARKVAAMFVSLYSTETIAPPFNKGVPGLLYLDGNSQSGMSSPVSVDTDATWTAVVKASPTAQAVGWKEQRVKEILPYVNADPEPAPTLLAIRPVGKGYLAALSITGEWLWAPPDNCPPVLDMLSRGQGGKPSNWIGLFANLFRYMAAPTLAAGKGGTPTPTSVLQPPPIGDRMKGWADEMLKPRDWTKAPPIDDQDQLPGLIGARSTYSGGKGTVAQWVTAAKAAGLKYLVFLEPLEFTSEENFNKLKADCAQASDDTFYACPGLWGQDVQWKVSMFCYGDKVQYPLATILTPDHKYFDDSVTWPKQMPTKYIFDYFFEQLGYKGQFGYFHHKDNPIPPWEYKMNNSFVIYSTDNGKPRDDAFDVFSYLEATDFCYPPTAISLMDDPAELAGAAKDDWRMVNVAPGEFGDGTYTEDYGQGLAAVRKLYGQQVAWLRPYQYITQGPAGPAINCWRGRWEIVIPFGEWYRPDQWRYRARLHVSSAAGLKEIVLMSAGQIYARFLPNGATDFDKTFDFENSQQRAMYPIITDMNGKRAIGSYIRNSNTLWNEFICGDRCNFLSYGMYPTSEGKWQQIKPSGNAVTANKGCWNADLTPSTTLTMNYPTLPIDGAPQGNATPSFAMTPQILTPGFPGGQDIESRPMWGVSGPDVLVGGASLDNIAVDDTRWGNAWSWWSPVQPNPYIEGYGLQTAFAPLLGGMRAGTYEFHLTARQDLPLTDPGLPVRFTGTTFTEFRDGDGHLYHAGDATPPPATGSFGHGAYVLVDASGGPAALYSMDDNLVYERSGQSLIIGLKPPATTIPKGAPITMKIGYLGAPSETDLEVMRHYFTTLTAPLAVTATSALTGDGIALHLDGKLGSADLRCDNLKLHALLPVMMGGLPANEDAWIVDRTHPAPNWRQIVKKNETAYATLPCDATKDFFIGCPVQAEDPALHITLCNTLPQQWVLTLHNPTDAAITTPVWSAKNWPLFTLARKVYTIPAGSSVEVPVQQR